MVTRECKRRTYSKFEMEVLLALIEKQRDIIDNKATDALSNRQKSVAWEAVRVGFNTVFESAACSVSQLQNAYRNMKRRALKNSQIPPESRAFDERLVEMGIMGAPSQSDLVDKTENSPIIIKTETIEPGEVENSENFANPNPITVEEVDTSNPSTNDKVTSSIDKTLKKATRNLYFPSRTISSYRYVPKRLQPVHGIYSKNHEKSSQLKGEAQLRREKLKKDIEQTEEKFKVDLQHTIEKHEQLIRHTEKRFELEIKNSEVHLQMEKSEHELKMQLLKAQILKIEG